MIDYLNQVHLGKWEDVMPTIPDNCVDMIISSPPYNVRLGDNKHKKDAYATYDDNMPYADYLRWMTDLFIECRRVLKSGGRMAINIGDGANGQVPTHVDFTNILVRELGFLMYTTIVWDKNQIGCSTAWGSFQSPSQPSFPTQFEFIIVVAKDTLKHEGRKEDITVTKENFIRNSRAMWTFSPETGMMRKYDHPAMFPEELPQRLIDQFTYRNDIILDPFSGAGTTVTVAKRMGRRYIGIEMAEKYWKVSKERLAMIPNMTDDTPQWIGE